MDFKLSPKLIDSLSPEDEARLGTMQEILKFFKKYPLVFKEGSAIMFFYQGDRFSEDLDFDAYASPERFWLPDVAR